MGFYPNIQNAKIQNQKSKKYKILKSKIQHQEVNIHHGTPKIQHPKCKIEKTSKISKKKLDIFNLKSGILEGIIMQIEVYLIYF